MTNEELSPYSIIISDNDGIMVAVNHKAALLFDYSVHEMLTHNVALLIPKQSKQAHDHQVERYLLNPTIKAIDRKLVGLRRDGTEIPITIELYPMKSGISATSSNLVLAIIKE